MIPVFKSKSVLFIIRHFVNNVTNYSHSNSTGLTNAASFTTRTLKEQGVNVKEVTVQDNNSVDKVVFENQPDYVIIDGLWVTPSKFEELIPLHPNVKWIVRMHSNLPFIAQEGIALNWINVYSRMKNVFVAFNSEEIYRSMTAIVNPAYRYKFLYLPNVAPVEPIEKYRNKIFDKEKDSIVVSCFGAARILKNQLLQATAAVDFANRINKKLRFMINVNPNQGREGLPIYTNLVALFKDQTFRSHKLVLLEWVKHDEFVEFCGRSDIAMQVSFTETFNITAVDTVIRNVPLVASKEVPWASHISHADCTSHNSMVDALLRAYESPEANVMLNQLSLKRYVDESIRRWLEFLREH